MHTQKEVEMFRKYAIHKKFEQIKPLYAASFSRDELL